MNRYPSGKTRSLIGDPATANRQRNPNQTKFLQTNPLNITPHHHNISGTATHHQSATDGYGVHIRGMQ